MGVIYCARNIFNNKLYIGKTNNTLQKRRSEHLRECGSRKTHFHRALIYYGKRNFYWSILDHAETEEELNNLEKFYIDMFSSADRAVGYNCTFGGDGASMTSESINKMRKSKLGKTSPLKGIKHTEEQNIKHSLAMKNKYANGYIHPNTGKSMPDYIKEKLIKANTGRPGWWKGKKIPKEAIEKMRRTKKEALPHIHGNCSICGNPFVTKSAIRKYCDYCISIYSKEELATKYKLLTNNSL